MADKKKQIQFKDGLFEFSKGINSGVAPIILPRDQLSFAINATVRGTFASNRPALRKISLDFQGDTNAQRIFEDQGLWQGGCFFKSEYGTEAMVVQIGGSLFQVRPDTTGGAVVTDVSIPGDLNNSGIPIAWMWQAERWMIIQNGQQLPIFYDGQTSRRSFGPTHIIGVTAIDWAVPAVGGSVDVTLVDPYTGPTNQVVLVDDVYYQVNSSGVGFQITLRNLTESAGGTIPIGTQLQIPSNLIGLTTTTVVTSNTFQPGRNGNALLQLDHPLTASEAFLFPGTCGGGATFIRTPDTGNTYNSSQALGEPHTPDAHSPVNCPTFRSNLAAGIIEIFLYGGGLFGVNGAIIPAHSAVYRGAFNSTSQAGVLNQAFAVPALGATVDVVLNNPYLGALGQRVVINGAVYEIVATNNTPVPSNTINITNINDNPSTVPNRGPGTPTTPGIFRTVQEIGVGRMGTYGKGRNWYSLPDGRSYRATDIVGSSSGSPALKFRDAVLRETHNTFLTTGDFVIPGNIGDIQSMTFMANLDTSLGQGPLQIGTPDTIFSCDAPVDESTWQSISNPIQTVSLKGQGSLSQYGAINLNSDLIFRSRIGWGSLILAIREFYTWGNTPISEELKRIVVQDDKTLLPFNSSIDFDNRLISTTKPVQSQAGVFHQGFMAMNLDPVSTLAGKSPSIYDGLWEGVNALQWIAGQFSGNNRAFAFSYNTVANKIELYELLKDNEATADFDGAENVPIGWSIESSVLFRNVKGKDPNDLCRLEAGVFFLANVVGEVRYEIFYRPQFHPCWILWDSGSVCANTNGQKQNKASIGIRAPSADDCDPSNNRPFKISESFQFKFVFHGSCQFYGARFIASAFDEPEFIPPPCKLECPVLDCVPDNDYGLYNLQNRALGAPATPFSNQEVFFTHGCPSGDILHFTGSLPYWVTFDSSLGFIGKAGTFVGTTQDEANANAQAQLDAIGNAAISGGTLTCGPAVPPAPTIVLVNIDTSGWTDSNAYGFVEVAGVLYGIGETNLFSSADGVNWASVGAHGMGSVDSMTHGLGLFVVNDGGFVGNIYSSPDGVVWTPHALAGNFPHSIAFGAGIFVALNFAGDSYTSPDGINWTQHVGATGMTFPVALTFGLGLFVAVGKDRQIFTSPDGVTWTARQNLGGDDYHCVNFVNSTFLAAGEAGLLYTSPDALIWTAQVSGVANDIGSVGGAGGTFLFVTSSGPNLLTYTSPDAAIWTLDRTVASFKTATHQGTQFLPSANVIDVGLA